MQMVKLKFQDPTHDAQGALELAKRFRVICLPEDTYEVPQVALAVLDALQLSYRILETEGFDHAVRALRNPPAPLSTTMARQSNPKSAKRPAGS
jgi:hypothetical protein